MKFDIITIFPNIFSSYFSESIMKRAQNNKIIKIKTHDLRKYSADKHRSVDGRPYGGGAGMVLMAQPIIKSVKSIKLKAKSQKSKTILLSAKGKKWNQALAQKYSRLDNIILICGRYEGVDERVKKFVDDEISVGEYVLTGGEIPAMVIVDSITRLLPNVLGNSDSTKFESHSQKNVLEHPHYSRPEILKINNKKYSVPKVLLSGDHKKINEWREKHGKLVK